MKRNIILYFLLLCSISIFAQGVVTPPRTCTVCKVTKPASEFSGDSKTCKACVKKKSETKICSSCKKTKALNAFSGSSKTCKECAKPQLDYCIGCRNYKPVTDFLNDSRCIVCYNLACEQAKEGYVDLGLPSGTLWAICNVGASKPEEYGDYFAWGETKGYKSGKVDFSRNNYKWWANGDEKKIIKYNNKDFYGKIDGKTELDIEDDAAYVNCGSQWRMPSGKQVDELKSKCLKEWKTFNGVNGWKLTGPNGNSIFLPVAGCRKGTEVDSISWGYYWSRSLNLDHPIDAEDMVFVEDKVPYWRGANRYSGRSVRPVRISQQEAEQIAAREQAEKERIAREQRDIRDGKCVDLGLPSGTLWATCNLGASKPEEYGDYFAWGETKGLKRDKYNFSWSTYKWGDGNEGRVTKYCDNRTFGSNGFTDNKMELELEDDAAYVNLGNQWRTPSEQQIKELKEMCTWSWTTYKGTKGYLVKGKNGNSIFLPAAGYIIGMKQFDAGSWGNYWSRSLSTSCIDAYRLCFQPSGKKRVHYYSNYGRFNGLTIRPVRVKLQD